MSVSQFHNFNFRSLRHKQTRSDFMSRLRIYRVQIRILNADIYCVIKFKFLNYLPSFVSDCDCPGCSGIYCRRGLNRQIVLGGAVIGIDVGQGNDFLTINGEWGGRILRVGDRSRVQGFPINFSVEGLDLCSEKETVLRPVIFRVVVYERSGIALVQNDIPRLPCRFISQFCRNRLGFDAIGITLGIPDAEYENVSGTKRGVRARAIAVHFR